MQSKKRVGFLLVLTLFILALTESVFALYELYYPQFDLLQFYLAWQGVLDPTIIAAFFALIFTLILPRVFGEQDEETKHTVKKLALILGIVAGLSLSYFGRNFFGGEGMILGLGPFWAFLGLLLFLFWIYSLFKGEQEGKLGWGVGLLILLLTLVLASILMPGLFEPITRLLFGSPIIMAILAVLGIIGAISLLLWASSLIKGGGRSSPKGGSPTNKEVDPGVTDNPPEKTQKVNPIRANLIILATPPFKPGGTISLIVDVEEKRGWFKKWKKAKGTFAASEWKINNLELRNKNGDPERNLRISYPIPQDITSEPLKIEVLVLDINNPQRIARAETKVEIEPIISKLVITEPTNTDSSRGIARTIGDDLSFVYKIEGTIPDAVSDKASWMYLEGTISKTITPNNIKEAKPIFSGNNENFKIGGVELDLEGGKVYTIICVALDNKDKFYVIPIVNKLLADSFLIEIKPSKGKTPQPNVGTPVVRILNHRTGSDNIYEKDTEIDAEIGDTITIQPTIKNGRIEDYEVDTFGMPSSIIKERAFDYGTRELNLVSEGKIEKSVRFTHKTNGKETEINITINALPKKNKTPEPADIEFSVIIYEEDEKTKKPVLKNRIINDHDFDAKVNEGYYFRPMVEDRKTGNNLTDEYDLSLVCNRNDSFVYDNAHKDKYSLLILEKPEVYEIITTFKKEGIIKKMIKCTVNAKRLPTPQPTIPEIKIKKINGQEVKSKSTIELPLNGTLIMEAEINDRQFIDTFYWVSQDKDRKIEPLGTNKAEVFEYPSPYFSDEYFRVNNYYQIIVSGKKNDKQILNDKGEVIYDWVFIKTLPATKQVKAPKWKQKKK